MKKHKKYHSGLKALLAIKRRLNIVVVGANDGKINDPIYDFVMSHSDNTSVLLIEPNKPLLPYLQKNYSAHPSHQIANCAIGEKGELKLYAIKQELWSHFSPAYARNWPAYRAATGVTSALKSHVKQALTRQNINPENAIESFDIPAKELCHLLKELNWTMPIDVLQIDAEGYDDVVLYNSDLNVTNPTLIYFESINMNEKKGQRLNDYLIKNQYKIYRVKGNSLAVKSGGNLKSLFLKLMMTFIR